MLSKLSPLIIKPEQHIVITLSLSFLSQIFIVRDAFHKNLAEVGKDRKWEAVKNEKVGESTSTRTIGVRKKAICHCHTFGKRASRETNIKGLLTGHQLFLLTNLFSNIKNILPHKENLVIETLRFVVTDTGGLETLHYVEDYTIKVEGMLGWSFHLFQCEERTYLSLWDDDKKNIQNVHITFGCAILDRSNVCRVGLGNSTGRMMLQGNFFADAMKDHLRDNTMYKVEPASWAEMTKNATTIGRSNIVTESIELIEDKTFATQVGSVVQQFCASYTFQENFLALMKTM